MPVKFTKTQNKEIEKQLDNPKGWANKTFKVIKGRDESINERDAGIYQCNFQADRVLSRTEKISKMPKKQKEKTLNNWKGDCIREIVSESNKRIFRDKK